MRLLKISPSQVHRYPEMGSEIVGLYCWSNPLAALLQNVLQEGELQGTGPTPRQGPELKKGPEQ